MPHPTQNRVPVPDYRRTANRRTFSELPDVLRERLSAHAGGRIVSVRSAGGGFTNGFAALLGSDTGAQIFAKAAPASDSVIYPAYERESRVVPRLPEGMPVPRLHLAEHHVVDGVDWQLLVYEAVEGRMPGQPWNEADLAAVESACVRAAERLSGFPAALAGDPLAEDMAQVPSQFAPIIDGGPSPWFLPELDAGQARLFQASLDLCPEALAGDAVLHGDLRPDNILISSGRALICDWNFLGTGAAWTDWVGVLPYARGGGLDADAWLRRSVLTRDVPAEYIDAWLAALLNYMINSGTSPEVPASPHLRSHGRYTAELIWDWAISRKAGRDGLPRP